MMHNEWLSAHVYFDSDVYSLQVDKIIVDVLGPALYAASRDGLITKWFFVRYVDVGRHIRVRVLGHRGVSGETVKSKLIQLIRHEVRRSSGSDEDRYDSDELTITWSSYERELDRYGGVLAINVAEEVFHQSSVLCLELISEGVHSARSAKLGKGVLALVVCLYVFLERRSAVADWCDAYAENVSKYLGFHERYAEWKRINSGRIQTAVEHISEYVAESWARLNDSASLTPPLDVYRNSLFAAKVKLEELHADGHLLVGGEHKKTFQASLVNLLPSQVHMTNNRLGLTLTEECYVANLVADGLRRQSSVTYSVA